LSKYIAPETLKSSRPAPGPRGPFGRRLAGILGLALLTSVLSIAMTGTQAQEQVQEQVRTPTPTGPAETAAPAERCGTRQITIADLRWPSASILAAIHALVLKREFGCDVAIVGGDNGATLSSMATTQQPAVAPELWIGRVAEVWNGALEAQTVRRAGNSYSGGPMQGWFVPGFATSATPGLAEGTALAENVQSFAADGRPARFVTCPLDWACNIINANLVRAFGISDGFETVVPANRFELDQVIAQAMSRREPILFYYWQPNAALAQFDFEAVDLGPFDPEALPCLAQPNCPNPKKSAFAPEPVIIAVADWLPQEAPKVFSYFGRAALPLAEMNWLLAWQNERNAEAGAVAEEFYRARSEIWKAWVAP
jgi:glycine betaine/proline transport system substrate-binding protein